MNWLNRKRLSLYSWTLVVVFTLITGFWYITGSGITDRRYKPFGTDYICFYAASDMARQGHLIDIYNVRAIWEKEKELVKREIDAVGWYYPPTFLLFVYPLSFLPYIASLVLWVGTSLISYLSILRRIVPDSIIYGLALSFPGTLQNILHGQNGFLTASFLGWGIYFLDKTPFMGGLILGLLSYKPHLAFLVFLGLMAGRYWKALAGVLVSAGTMAITSLLLFGWDMWLAFKTQLPFVSKLINFGYLPWEKLSTVFAASRLLGIEPQVAYFIQGIFTVAMIGIVIWVWSGQKLPFSVKVPVLVAAIFLATPYAFQYDLTLFGLALAWYGWECHRKGWQPYEKAILFMMWLTPMINDPIARVLKVQIVPVILILFLILIYRRINSYKKDILK